MKRYHANCAQAWCLKSSSTVSTFHDAGDDDLTILNSIGAVFDHAAHAVPSIRAVLPLYRDLLGGTVVVGGINPWGGHLAIQLEYPHGGRIELLEPVKRESSSVGKFLERSPKGGLHHLTFKVDDLAACIETVTNAGFRPFGTMLDQPTWKETYLHPRETGGVLIQLAQARPGFPGLEQPVEALLDQAEAMRRSAGM